MPSARLDILVPTHMTRHRKPKAVRAISAAMGNAVKMALVQERKSILEQCPGFKMLGCSFILSDKTIAELCALAPSLTSVDDLNGVATLRPEHRYRAIIDVVSLAPCRNVQRRVL